MFDKMLLFGLLLLAHVLWSNSTSIILGIDPPTAPMPSDSVSNIAITADDLARYLLHNKPTFSQEDHQKITESYHHRQQIHQNQMRWEELHQQLLLNSQKLLETLP